MALHGVASVKSSPMILRLLFCALAALTLPGCSGLSSPSGRTLEGVWISTDATVGSVIWRKPDGTFEERKVQRLVLGQPPIRYEASGQWRVKGDEYAMTYRQISSHVFSEQAGREYLFSDENLKEYKMRITSLSTEKFRYISTDGADVEETKVGKSRKAVFETTPVPPLAATP